MSTRQKIIVTCPPMLGMIDSFQYLFEKYGWVVTAPTVEQTLSVEDLIEIVPQHDGWIIGDDPATRKVFEVGSTGRLKAAVKWGVGVDNVDFAACKDFNIPITNTPSMFGAEVADIAMGYIVGLARETFQIDDGVRQGIWPKPSGISLSGKTVALVGYGDIGKNTAKRMLASDMCVIAYDPFTADAPEMPNVERAVWPQRLNEADFLVVTCALTDTSRHMVNAETLGLMKPGVRVINVGRGPVIHQVALENALKSGHVYSAALDVFEQEPLSLESYLRSHPRCILGSHNASNTEDAVARTSEVAIRKLAGFLDGK